MIQLTRINHTPLVLNSDLIEHIEVTPDTVITLVTGQKLRVRESAAEVIQRVVDFRQLINGQASPGAAVLSASLIRLADGEPSEEGDENGPSDR